MNWKYRKISQEAKDVLLSFCDNSPQYCSHEYHIKTQNRKSEFLPSLPLSNAYSLSKRSQTVEYSKIEMKMIELSTFLHQSVRLQAKRFIEIPNKTVESKSLKVQKKYSLPSTQRSIRAILMKNKLKMGMRKSSQDRRNISRIKLCK